MLTPMTSITAVHTPCCNNVNRPCATPGIITLNASFAHPETPADSRSGLDQPTCHIHIHNRRDCSVNRNRQCLKVVDRFRREGTNPGGPARADYAPASGSRSWTQCRTGTDDAVARCAKHPMFAVAITSGLCASRLSIFRTSSSRESFGCRME